MAKKRAPKIHARGEKRGAPGPSPLLVIAGLPRATAVPAAMTINNDGSSTWRAVATAFTSRDQDIYTDANGVFELGRLACEFAIAGAHDADGVPTPSRIVVAYVRANDSKQLWDVFGHAAWPLPLNHPDWTWPEGRHWRHEIEAVSRVLQQAIASLETGTAEALRLRLEAHRTEDVLLLPGRNFHLRNGQRLIERFRAFVSGDIGADGVEEGVQVEKFSYERLAEFYKRVGGKGKRFAVDNRDIVFAKSNHGQDGGLHQIPADASLNAALLMRTLESRYRFGTPLKPAGFQHDAQLEKGGRFDRERFECTIKGAVQMSGDHVNIFPSDVVTGAITG